MTLPEFLRKKKYHYSVLSSPSLDSVLNKLKPGHILSPYLTYTLILSFQLRLHRIA